MGFAIGFLIVNILLVVIFAPIGVGVKSHLSLARRAIYSEIAVFGLVIFNIVARLSENGMIFTVNGKNIEFSRDGLKGVDIVQVIGAIKTLNVGIKLSAIALFGVGDSKNSAILCAIIGNLPNVTIYPSNNEQFEVDVKAKTRLSVLNAIRLLAKSNRRVYGHKQFDK